MKIAYLGAGTWGFCLASLLASKGFEVTLWLEKCQHKEHILKHRMHPKLKGLTVPPTLQFSENLGEVLNGADYIIESVTSAGFREVCKRIFAEAKKPIPLVITSKGIEQNSCLLLPEVAEEVFGPGSGKYICCLSGPSHAEEVVQHLPTSVVSSSKNKELASDIQELFSTPYFRVYTNPDLLGVAFGGAMKNIIAIACGISDGLGFGDNTKAALMTRGLHEIKKLAKYKGANPETLSGLSGLGDLCVTCLSSHSRNYRFGHLIAQGRTADEARKEIGMAVEGAYTVVSAKQLSERNEVPMPITESVYKVLVEGLSPKDGVRELMQRSSKEEML